MSRQLLLALAFTVLGLAPAKADVVYFETNNWQQPRTLTWQAGLDKIDQATGIAYFHFMNRGTRCQFALHISRILSLAFDLDDRRDKDFPATRAKDLKVALGVSPEQDRYIQLSNDDDLGTSLPPNLVVKPDRKSTMLTLRGQVVSFSGKTVKLSVQDVSHANQTIAVDRNDFQLWVR